MDVELMDTIKGMGPRSEPQGKDRASTVEDEAVDLQHRTRVDREMHSCAKSHFFQ
jgi:hypothetical protein